MRPSTAHHWHAAQAQFHAAMADFHQAGLMGLLQVVLFALLVIGFLRARRRARRRREH